MDCLLKRKRVAIFPGSRFDAERRLLATLAELYPLEFVRGEQSAPERVEGAICFPEAWGWSDRLFKRGINSFQFAQQSSDISLAAEAGVRFASHATLHAAFKGAEVPLGGEIRAANLRVDNGDVPLAYRASTVLWKFRPGDEAELHTTAVAPPALADEQFLWSHLVPENWIGLFPLLHFLRRVSAEVDWSAAPCRACFIFEDPNLHSSRYGYLDFVELARQASEHNYHAALATVPLDAFYAASRTVELFRASRDRLSLLIHGNNHIRNELCCEYSGEDGLCMLAQSLIRIRHLESKTRLRVSRVIVPPHGRCSASMMSQMVRLGFEAVCSSVQPIVRCNRSEDLPLSFGLSPASLVAGLPVIRRYDLRYGILQLRFAAFLGQPLLPYGHHQDCASGLSPLGDVADAVNTWGSTWCTMEEIVRSRFRTKREGELLHVELCARQVAFCVPPGVNLIVIHSALCPPDKCDVTVTCGRGGEIFHCPPRTPLRVAPSAALTLKISAQCRIDPATLRKPAWEVWPPLRRGLAIARDRLMPMATVAFRKFR